jgi:urease subunit gamma/beta
MILRIPGRILRSPSKVDASSLAIAGGGGRRTNGIVVRHHASALAATVSFAANLLPRRAGWNNVADNPSIIPTIDARQRRYLHLAPRETDHLLLHSAGRLAQYRLARGLRLNVPESRALIAMQMMEMVRNGSASTIDGADSSNRTTLRREGSVSSLMSIGTRLLGRNQVMPGVANLVREVQVEATFPDGTKLLTIHDPIGMDDGDMSLALEGSFLPVPDLSVFRTTTAGGEMEVEEEGEGYPGQTLVSSTLPDIEINPGRSLIELSVTNTGDRPIQVGSHYRELSYIYYDGGSLPSLYHFVSLLRPPTLIPPSPNHFVHRHDAYSPIIRKKNLSLS